MKRNLPFLVTLFSLFPLFLSAQDLTGIWRGYFITEDGEQYRYEVQIDHGKGALTGVTYSYLDKRFYGKATFTGNFSLRSNNALVQEIKTVEVKMSTLSASCIQKCLLTYAKSGREEFLEGTFTSTFEKTDTVRGIVRGDNCGGGTMVLRKVPTSDFYVEPFLRKRTTPNDKKIENPIVKNNTTPKPPPNNTKKNNTTSPNPNNSNTTTKISRPKSDPINKIDSTTKGLNANLQKRAVTVPLALKSRENDLVQTLIVNTEDVTVKLYDNGEIDDDTISVYLNNRLVLSKQRLTAAALTVKLKMDESNSDHELVMVAENLGRIPPNTSLMIVTAGDKRYEVRITSTEQRNAMVRFKYIKLSQP
jgi:hypothetical protein